MTAGRNSHGQVRQVNNCPRQTRQALALIAGRNARFRGWGVQW